MHRVLIVEDDAVFRRGLARMFSKEECEVTQLATESERLLLSATPCLTLLYAICDCLG